MTLWLSRFHLSDRPEVSALSALLDPIAQSERLDAHHRLIWTAFAGDPNAKRDFLWRDMAAGRFLVLSARAPADTALFSVDTKPFSPDLRKGDQLIFDLRANATRTERTGEQSATGQDKKRHIDLVMDRLYSVPKGQRAACRMDAAQEVSESWCAAQGTRAGFTLDALSVADYSTVALPQGRGRRKGCPQFGITNMSGCLTVRDPDAFVAALARGFGRAKAFGCGLMLIRRR